jgi:hypothetical protein
MIVGMARRTPSFPLTAEETIALVSQSEKRPLSRGMLQHYTAHGYVRLRPIHESRNRRGRPSTHGYDLGDVVLLRWLVRLAIEGIKVNRFSQGIQKLRSLMPDALRNPSRLEFFVVGRGSYAVKHEKRVIELTGRHQGQVLLTFASRPDVENTLATARSLHA